MSLFLTGGTGYLGGYAVAGLLRDTREDLVLLVRARDAAHAAERLWAALQLHLEPDALRDALAHRIRVVLGELSEPRLGLAAPVWDALAEQTSSVLHIAASLNRKSAKTCFNTNLRGTLQVVHLARAAQARGGLRRFTDVSTTAVAGHRAHETVHEDTAVDWERSDYDPYARTKKFAEHMVHELLDGVPRLVVRPSTVLGDSRRPETTQFDMVRAFSFLVRLPVVPLDPAWRMDFVPADYVGRALVALHTAATPAHGTYHLAGGEASPTYGEVVEAVYAGEPGRRRPRFVPALEPAFAGSATALSNSPRAWGLDRAASLIRVFWPYIVYDTVFDNRRVTEALGEPPAPFVGYAGPLLRWAEAQRFRFPYAPWPGAPIAAREVAP